MGADGSKFNVCVSAGPDAPDMVFRFDIRNPEVTVGEVLDAVQVWRVVFWGRGKQGDCSSGRQLEVGPLQAVNRTCGGGASGEDL